MKLFLDDVRNAPDSSWIVVRDARVLLNLLQILLPIHERIEAISLDHDLGIDLDTGEYMMSGYQFLNELEKFLADPINHKPWFNVNWVTIHSANPVGRQDMQRALASIKRLMEGV